jgi:hypothetical protein
MLPAKLVAPTAATDQPRRFFLTFFPLSALRRPCTCVVRLAAWPGLLSASSFRIPAAYLRIASGKLALFAARIQAADTGDDAPIRILIQPCELAMDPQGELTGVRDDQGKRCGIPLEALQAAEQMFFAMASP